MRIGVLALDRKQRLLAGLMLVDIVSSIAHSARCLALLSRVLLHWVKGRHMLARLSLFLLIELKASLLGCAGVSGAHGLLPGH